MEKLTNKNIQTQAEKFRAELGSPLHYEIEEEFPKVTRKPTSIYPVIIQEKSLNNRHPQGYGRAYWNPVQMLALRRF